MEGLYTTPPLAGSSPQVTQETPMGASSACGQLKLRRARSYTCTLRSCHCMRRTGKPLRAYPAASSLPRVLECGEGSRVLKWLMKVEKGKAGEVGKDIRHHLRPPPFTGKETWTYRGKTTCSRAYVRIGEEACFSCTSFFAVIKEGAFAEHLLCTQSHTKLHGELERSSETWFPV